MFRVLIVDDFGADRLALRRIIDSLPDIDVNVVGECENGQEAMDLIESCRPDIIISDIEMPICDGFELAKKIRIEHPHIKIIFCSLYDEFEYAKRALYLDSYGYILKPIDPVELRESIVKVTGSLYKDTFLYEQVKEYEQLKATLESNKPILIENELKGLIYGFTEADASSVIRKLNYLGVDITEGYYGMLLIEIDDFGKLTEEIAIEKQQILSMRVFEKVNSMLGGYPHSVLTRVDDSHFAWICSFESAIPKHEAAATMSETGMNVLVEYRKSDVSLTMSVSSFCDQIGSLHGLYEQCRYLMKHKYMLGKGILIYHDEVPSSPLLTDIDYSGILKETRFLLNSGTREAIAAYIDELFVRAFSEGRGDQHNVRNLCYHLLSAYQTILQENNESFSSAYRIDAQPWETLSRFETVADSQRWLKEVAEAVNKHFSHKAQNKNRYMTEQVKRYIEKNYVKNFSLDVLAADLFYSQNYLARVFKQETGESIYDYATRYRVEKAKEMLADPQVKLYEVTDKLGYSNPSYFSYVFKKITGMTPKEFKERTLK